MVLTFDLPNLGNLLVTKEFTGPLAASRASESTCQRGGDGFSFLGPGEPYLRLETAELGLESVRVRRVTSSGHRFQFENAHEDWVIVTWPLVGAISTKTHSGTLTAQPGQCLIVPPGQRVVTVQPGTSHFTADRLMVSWAALAPALAHLSVSAQELQLCVQSVSANPSGMQLYRAVCQLLAPSAMPAGSSGGSDAKRRAIEAHVLDLAAAALLEAGSFRQDGQRPTTTLQLVRAAEGLIRTNATGEVSIEHLCERLDVSDRSLQMAFQKVRGYSARTYLLKVRLEAARQRLMVSDIDNAVTEAAFGAGFSHLGRFSAYYRQRYGETPSQTLRRRQVQAPELTRQ